MRTCTLPTAFAELVAALSQRCGFSESLACTTKPRWSYAFGGCKLMPSFDNSLKVTRAGTRNSRNKICLVKTLAFGISQGTAYAERPHLHHAISSTHSNVLEMVWYGKIEAPMSAEISDAFDHYKDRVNRWLRWRRTARARSSDKSAERP